MTMLRKGAATALLLLMCATTANAASRKGDTSLGPKLGYISKNKSALAGLVFQYSFSDRLRLSPEISYAFRNDGLDAFIVDVNAHVPFDFTGDKVCFYPLAGITFNSWSIHRTLPGIDDVDVSSHANRWGMNLGAGFDLRCSQTMKLTLEARYCLVKSYSNVQITAGVAYIF